MKLNFPQCTQQNLVSSDVHRREEHEQRRKTSNSGISENIFEVSSNENGLFKLYSNFSSL